MRLNRLSRWNVVALNLAALTFTVSAVQARSVLKNFALRLELDINTVPDLAGAIPHGRLVDVYRELVAGGHAIATNGVVNQ